MMDVHNVVMSLSRRRRFPSTWLGPDSTDPEFPAFVSRLAGGTAWYTMRLTALTEDREQSFDSTLAEAVAEYESREAHRVPGWNAKFRPARAANVPSGHWDRPPNRLESRASH